MDIKQTEENKEPKTLQVKVMKRFLTDEEWRDFRKEYLANRKMFSMRNRADGLSVKIDEEEVELLKTYLQDTDTTIKDMAKAEQMSPGMLIGRVHRTALRILYQNPSILSRMS